MSAIAAGASSEPALAARGALARNALHLVLGQAATTTIAIVLNAALGRSLGAADFGLYFLVTTTSTLTYVLVEWGQGTFVTREVAREPRRAGELLGTALGLRIAGSIVLAALAVLATWALGHEARVSAFTALMLGTLLPFFVSQAYAAVFRGRERMDLDAQVSVLNKALTFAFTMLALGWGAGLVGVMIAQGAAGVGSLALASFQGRRLSLPRLTASGQAAREVLLGGTPIVAMTLAIAAYSYLEANLLSKLAPPATVGWYAAARTIVGTLIAPATILGTAAFPRFARAAGDAGQLRSEIHSATRPLLAMAALAGVGTYLFADTAVGLIYGREKFGPAVLILQVFALGLFLVFVDVLLGSIIMAVGRPRSLAVAKVINVAAGGVLNSLLIPYCQRRYGNGGIGVALSFGLSEIIMFASALWLVPRGSLDLKLLADLLRALAAGVATLVVFRLLPALTPALGIAACVLTFAACAAATRLVVPSDLLALRELLHRRR